jgi:DNA phosphorothioation-dependent restriction protein DptF
MDFNSLLSTLSRSSAQAVSTLSKASGEIEEFKNYLYVETEIERKLIETLESNVDAKKIIFLCGSSGDGKSELLRRNYANYSSTYKFHLDATHSFKPDQSAIEALDELFDHHQLAGMPLIVGINIGMMFNYYNSGAERHNGVKDAIGQFIAGQREVGQYSFLSFEDYPKFSLKEGEVGSSFVKQLFSKVTSASMDNPLYRAYLNDVDKHHKLIFQNYRILQEESVQGLVIKLLLHARLKFDQFFSSRSLLDFIYHLIAGGSSIFDNFFASTTSGLASTFTSFDPCLTRSKRVDEFVVQQSLKVEDVHFEAFKIAFIELYQTGFEVYSASTWVRAFYLLGDVDIGNNYHHGFAQDFSQPIFDEYIRVWQLHNSNADPKVLREFYDKTLIASLIKFANRLVPKTVTNGIYIGERNGVFLSADVKIRLDTKRVASANDGRIHFFNATVKVDDKTIQAFPVNISFLELAERILGGYRPNRHDKNSVVILEEVLEEIVSISGQTDTLHFHIINNSAHWSLTQEEDEYIVEALH